MATQRAKKSVGPYRHIEPDILSELINFIDKDGRAIHTYSTQTPLFYQGQTPIVAYLLLKGKIILKKNKRIKELLGPGTLVGLSELFHHSTSPYEAMVMKDASVVFIDKSTIKSLCQNSNLKLTNFINNLIN